MDLSFTDKEIAQLVSEKKRTIGSSDAQHLFTFPAYACPRRLRYIKTGAQPDHPFNGNRATQRGNYMEEIVAQLYAAEFGVGLVKYPFVEDKEYPFLSCHVDRVTDEPNPSIIEIKVPGKEGFHDMKWNGVPAHYQIQVQWQLMLLNLERAELVAFWADGWDIRRYEILRDREIGTQLKQTAIQFWNKYVLGNDIPEKLPAGDRRCAKCPFRLQCQGEGLMAMLDAEQEREEGAALPEAPELVGALAAYEESAEIKREAAVLHEASKTKLQELIGDRTGMSVGDASVYYRPQPLETLQKAPLLKAIRQHSSTARELQGVDTGWAELRFTEFIEEAANLADRVSTEFTNRSITRPLRVVRKKEESRG